MRRVIPLIGVPKELVFENIKKSISNNHKKRGGNETPFPYGYLKENKFKKPPIYINHCRRIFEHNFNLLEEVWRKPKNFEHANNKFLFNPITYLLKIKYNHGHIFPLFLCPMHGLLTSDNILQNISTLNETYLCNGNKVLYDVYNSSS